MSFASEPGRDDGGLPPVNIMIPDDARELERDVLAYRREVRAQRRRQRLLRLLRPVHRATVSRGHVAIVPLIALFLAISLVGGALLSVVTMGPAAAPTVSDPAASAKQAAPPSGLTMLPTGKVEVGSQLVPVRSLTSSAIALVPAHCDCGPLLQRLADQATKAGVRLYFIGAGVTRAQLDTLTARYGDGLAAVAADPDGVLSTAYHPASLTVLLVYQDATAEVHRNLTATFQFGPTLTELQTAGALQPARQPAQAQPTPPLTG